MSTALAPLRYIETTDLVQPYIVPIVGSRGKEIYRLERDWSYEWTVGVTDSKEDAGHGHSFRLNIPTGFQFDGVSAPRIVWTLSGILPDGLQRAAGMAHDFLYQHGGRLPEGSHQYLGADGAWSDVVGVWGRKDADMLFMRLMKEGGVSSRRRTLMYYAVRAFGWQFWKG